MERGPSGFGQSVFEMERVKYLIIGGGPAGIFAAEAIRMRDRENPVVVVSEDPAPAHSPVTLTYWMGGHLTQEGLFFRDPSWAVDRGIDVRPNSSVVSVDTSSKKITLAEGHTLPYDRLLIATGASPIALSLPGKESKGVSSLRRVGDAERILETGSDIREVAIIGGGFIGLKLACHLKERGLKVRVFDKELKLAARMFDRKTSGFVANKLRDRGIGVETGVEIMEYLSEKGWVSGVRLEDGRTFSCQRVIEAVGVKPNIQFLTGSGIDLKGGVLVNERMETNIPGIYSAGDVAMTVDSITSERVNNAIWPAATRQGRVAGWNMAGGHKVYHHNFTWNALNLFGLQIMCAGYSYEEKESGVDVLMKEEENSYRRIVVKEGRLIGFILAGDVSGAGFLLSLMKRKAEVSHARLDLLTGPVPNRNQLPPQLGYEHGFPFRRTDEITPLPEK
jgi:NAD(P)H-nitrite reductase large subunit